MMSRGVWIGIAVVALIIGCVVGAVMFPRHVTVTQPGQIQTHTVIQQDSLPYAVLSDSIAKLLRKRGIPVPPAPSANQAQLIYGFSYIGKKLCLSILDTGATRFHEETFSSMEDNFYVAWRDTGAYWDVTSWPTSMTPEVVPAPVVKVVRWWRPTVSAGVVWFPGNEAVVSVSPGILVLGHLKVGVDGRLTVGQARAQNWGALAVGILAELVW
jgi:hypothetical protein